MDRDANEVVWAGCGADGLKSGRVHGSVGESAGSWWGMLPNALRGIELMSEGVVQLVEAIILWPAVPTHLVIHVVHCGVKEVKVSLHDETRVLCGVPEVTFPFSKPRCLNLVLCIVRGPLLVFLNKDCHGKHIAL